MLLVDIYQKDSSETSLFAAQIFGIELIQQGTTRDFVECFSEVEKAMSISLPLARA